MSEIGQKPAEFLYLVTIYSYGSGNTEELFQRSRQTPELVVFEEPDLRKTVVCEKSRRLVFERLELNHRFALTPEARLWSKDRGRD